jgi:hypothetical protein
VRRPRFALVAVFALLVGLTPLHAGATEGIDMSDNVDLLDTVPFEGAAEVAFDGERYVYAGQIDGRFDRGEFDHGGVKIIDLGNERAREARLDGPGQARNNLTFSVVGELECPGNDNYVRYLDPEVFNTADGDREFIVVAHHENDCTEEQFPEVAEEHGGHAIQIVDVTDKSNPQIVAAVAHDFAHTVMPHPTRPYVYILPGGLANGTSTERISPTGIVNLEDPTNPEYVRAFEHNVSGCHDLGYTHDGDYAYCAGLGETQVWDISGDNIENPRVVNTIVNPAIQFAHNAVVSPDGQYMLINDEAFGFHTCSGEAADLYGSLWIYDISIPDVPVLAGRISPPEHPDGPTNVGHLPGWVESWCAAHNYNFVPGTNIVVASWFAGGTTVHDITNPLAPEEIAHFQPDDGVAWTAHYYGGLVLTGDMARGVDILDIPELRAAATDAENGSNDGLGVAAGLGAAGVDQPRVDLTDSLVPDVLPPRPDRPGGESGFCVLPASRS